MGQQFFKEFSSVTSCLVTGMLFTCDHMKVIANLGCDYVSDVQLPLFIIV